MAVTGDREKDTARAIRSNDVVLYVKPVVHLRHVADINRRSIYGLDGQVVQLIQLERAAVDANQIFRSGELSCTRRQDQVLLVKSI